MEHTEPLMFMVLADNIMIRAVGAGSKEEVIITCSDPERVRKAVKAADSQQTVNIVYGQPDFVSGWDTPIGVLTALLAVSPGKSFIAHAPVVALIELWVAEGNEERSFVY